MALAARGEPIMSSTKNKALTLQWFEDVWNAGRLDVADELLSPDCTAHGLGHEAVEPRGPAAFKVFFHAFRDAFPDLHVTVEDIFGEDDRVVARCTVRGTHSGHGIGIMPSNTSIQFSGMCILRFEQGKIIEGWNSFDLHTLYQQIERAEALTPTNSVAARSVLSIPE
jgi:steroid delta-isomerase-like uncharacterized protein